MKEELFIFPDHFLPIQEWDPEKLRDYPVIIGGFDQQKVIEAITQKTMDALTWRNPKREDLPKFPMGGSHFKIISLDFSGRISRLFPWSRRTLWLALHGFLVFNPPIESKSKERGSDAVYYGAHKKMRLLLQCLRRKTSFHRHIKVRWIEIFRLLVGKAKLQTSEGQYLLEKNNPIIIKPEVFHQATALSPSLILIEIQGDDDWLEKWLAGEGHEFEPLIPKNT